VSSAAAGGRSSRVLAVGDAASLAVKDADGMRVASVLYGDVRLLTISAAGLYSLTVENSDGFLNILSLSVSDMGRMQREVRSHGLIGQSWKAGIRGREVSEVEGVVDDYAESSGDLLGCGFVFNQFSCDK
jgi:hypothetical protein